MLLELIFHVGVFALNIAFVIYGTLLFIIQYFSSFLLQATYNENKERKKLVIVGGGLLCFRTNHFLLK